MRASSAAESGAIGRLLLAEGLEDRITERERKNLSEHFGREGGGRLVTGILFQEGLIDALALEDDAGQYRNVLAEPLHFSQERGLWGDGAALASCRHQSPYRLRITVMTFSSRSRVQRSGARSRCSAILRRRARICRCSRVGVNSRLGGICLTPDDFRGHLPKQRQERGLALGFRNRLKHAIKSAQVLRPCRRHGDIGRREVARNPRPEFDPFGTRPPIVFPDEARNFLHDVRLTEHGMGAEEVPHRLFFGFAGLDGHLHEGVEGFHGNGVLLPLWQCCQLELTRWRLCFHKNPLTNDDPRLAMRTRKHHEQWNERHSTTLNFVELPRESLPCGQLLYISPAVCTSTVGLNPDQRANGHVPSHLVRP